MGWLRNTIPSEAKLGVFVEVFSMFYDRNLTEEGVEHKNKSIRWLGVFIIMAVVFSLVIARLKS